MSGVELTGGVDSLRAEAEHGVDQHGAHQVLTVEGTAEAAAEDDRELEPFRAVDGEEADRVGPLGAADRLAVSVPLILEEGHITVQAVFPAPHKAFGQGAQVVQAAEAALGIGHGAAEGVEVEGLDDALGQLFRAAVRDVRAQRAVKCEKAQAFGVVSGTEGGKPVGIRAQGADPAQVIGAVAETGRAQEG